MASEMPRGSADSEGHKDQSARDLRGSRILLLSKQIAAMRAVSIAKGKV